MAHPPLRQLRRCARLAVLAAAAALPACSFVPPREPPPVAAPPPHYGNAPGDPAPIPAGGETWWRSFGDPALDRLVARALADNLELRQLAARVDRARAQARLARAPLLPALAAQLQGDRRRQPLDALAIPGLFEPDDGGPARLTEETWRSTLSLSYEIDLWGRLRAGAAAGRANVEAALWDRRAGELSLVGEVVAAYFDLRLAHRRIALTRQSIEVLRDRRDLVSLRYRRGLVGSFELYSIDRALRAAEAALPQLRARRAALDNALAVLIGGYAWQVGIAPIEQAMPVAPPTPLAPGIPAALLSQRPDLLAARARMEAARQQVGAERAARLPALDLSLAAGAIGASPAEAFDASRWFTQAIATLAGPLFDGGRGRARVDAAMADYREALSAYGRALVGAVAEVETALARLADARERVRLAESEVTSAEATLAIQQRRYRRGVGDFAGFLDAALTRLEVAQSAASARRDAAVARADLHRAVGGALASAEGGAHR